MPEQELREIKRVMVGLGTTPESVTAFLQALGISRRLDAELHVIHVIEPVPPAAAEAMPELVELHEKHEVEAFTAFARAHNMADVALIHIRKGEPEEIIIDEIKENRIDLVIFGRYGKGGRKIDRLGSVAHRLVRSSPVSVLIVDPENPEPFRRIGVATGFNAESDVLVRRAIQLAKLYGQDTIEVLHAYVLPRGYHHAMSEEQACEKLEALAVQRCAYLQKNFGDKEGVKLHVITDRGDVRTVVPKLTEQAEIDLLIVGAHGRSKPAMFMLGRTTESIINGVHCATWATKRAEWYQGFGAVISTMLGT